MILLTTFTVIYFRLDNVVASKDHRLIFDSQIKTFNQLSHRFDKLIIVHYILYFRLSVEAAGPSVP